MDRIAEWIWLILFTWPYKVANCTASFYKPNRVLVCLGLPVLLLPPTFTYNPKYLNYILNDRDMLI